MTKTSKEIVRDLLKEANYYWHDDNEDLVNPINPDLYDPVVDKIFKANAVELEKLYAEIEDSRNEIVLGLSNVLVPNQSLLPEPGYTVAQIQPKSSKITTSPEDSYQINGQSDTGEQYEYYFTSIFEHDYPKCEILAILTENTAIQADGDQLELVNTLAENRATSFIWLGLKIDNIEDTSTIPFFLGNEIIENFDKNHHVFNTANWLLNGEQDRNLKVRVGIAHFESYLKDTRTPELLDTLKVPNSYEKHILNRFKDSFILVDMPADIQNQKNLLPPNFHNEELADGLSIDEALVWVKLNFSLEIQDDFFINNVLYPNCIPLINRRLLDGFVVKRNYDRILFPMPVNDLFLDIYKVRDAGDIDNNSEYRRIDFLHPNSSPGTFTLRSGSRVRRLNKEDASRQIHRLLEIIHDEYSTFKEEGVNRLRDDFDVIEKAINRIKGQLPGYFREEQQKSPYFCVANFKSGASRLYYYYWETQGDDIQHLGDKINLEVTSDDVNISNSFSILPIQRGKGELSAEDYLDQLKIAIVSGGKIMTQGDIQLYCKGRFGHLLVVKDITRELMTFDDGKLGRGILVTIILINEYTSVEEEIVRKELQNDLNSKSAFFTQIKVKIDHGE